jgi:threonine/homoserine/homoserine lactone efflux protein
MHAATFILFLPACFAINLAPGPNNLLALSNASRYGVGRACAAGLGRLLAFTGMIVLASAGLAVVLHASELVFDAIKIVGAGYLIFLAVRLWRAPVQAQEEGALVSARWLAMGRQEFLVAAGNPKAILVFTAFLPQFVEVGAPIAPQFALLGATFLVLEAAALAAYAYMGAHLRRWFVEARGRRVFNRICAALLAAAGFGLLFSRRTS